MMEVICVSSKLAMLTPNNKYNVIQHKVMNNIPHYLVVLGVGKNLWVDSKYFITIEEKRNRTIKEILEWKE